MARGLVQHIKGHISNLRDEIKATEIQLNNFRRLTKGSIVLVHFVYLQTVRAGCGNWIATGKPTLLRYIDWCYSEEGFTLDFDVLATEEDEPYDTKQFQPEYSGLRAKLEGFQEYLTEAKKRMEFIPKEDLPLYLGFPHTTTLFRSLLKGEK